MTVSLTRKRCLNCNELPQFKESDDPDYDFLLVHDVSTCPNRKHIYHNSEKECIDVWNFGDD